MELFELNSTSFCKGQMMIESVMVREGWSNCIVAASGPSLTEEVAQHCHHFPVIVVNNAHQRLPWAEVLYAGDRDWWELYHGCPDFAGEKWSVHESVLTDKSGIAERYGLRLVAGHRHIDAPGFSLDPKRIHYGNSSGFQAINLALLFGATRIMLVGFDMRTISQRHFHADYPDPAMNLSRYEYFIPAFNEAARMLPTHIQIINCTPHSGLRCFPMMDLEAALAEVFAL